MPSSAWRSPGATRRFPALPVTPRAGRASRQLTTASYLGKAQVALTLGNVGCADCHVDAHRGRLAAQTAAGPISCLHHLPRQQPFQAVDDRRHAAREIRLPAGRRPRRGALHRLPRHPGRHAPDRDTGRPADTTPAPAGPFRPGGRAALPATPVRTVTSSPAGRTRAPAKGATGRTASRPPRGSTTGATPLSR